MQASILHGFELEHGARFLEVNGFEVVEDFGDVKAEHEALRRRAGVLDLSFRGRVCLTGVDRIRFLHGQVTNDIKRLQAGSGCYAALVNAKGKMECDLNVYCLADELLLDFEPGFTASLTQRLEKYVVADDVQVVEVGSLYGLLSVQGPAAAAVVNCLEMFDRLPATPFEFSKGVDSVLGEVYLANQPRLGTSGFDLLVPTAVIRNIAKRLAETAKTVDGRLCGWRALEIARVEAGIPRFGIDMDETCLPQECGIEARAVSYSKGCYVGQEVLNRIHTMGHVNRELRGLRLANDLPSLPVKGNELWHEGKKVGVITSAVDSPVVGGSLALGFVHRSVGRVGTRLILQAAYGESAAEIVELPFR